MNSKVDLSDDALRLAYEREKETWAIPEKVRVAEVLINPGPGAEEKAREAVTVAKGGAKFEDVVVRFSDGPTRSKGGDMGTVGKGELAAALDAVAFSLPAGAISDPIETRSGWHVLKIVEKVPATFRPYSEVKADILKKEQETQFQKKLAEYLEKLEREAVIKVSGEATRVLPAAGGRSPSAGHHGAPGRPACPPSRGTGAERTEVRGHPHGRLPPRRHGVDLLQRLHREPRGVPGPELRADPGVRDHARTPTSSSSGATRTPS